MKLAIVSPFPPNITGIGQYGYYVSRLLVKSGLFEQINVVTGGSEEYQSQAGHPGIDVSRVWKPESLTTSLKIASELQRLQPDLVWFNLGASIFGRSPMANLSGFFSPLLARGLGFPTVVTFHELIERADLRALKSPGGWLAPFGARLITQLALQADVVCLTTQGYVDWMAQKYTGKRFMHIPIGAYHTPECLPTPTKPGREILFFTTLAPFKGLELLLDAFSILKDSCPDLRLTIAGADNVRFPRYSAQLKQRTANIPGIRWLGQVPEGQVRDLYQQADIVCIPYTASTGSSSVLYQAATWGRPVVASNLAETLSIARENKLEVRFFQNGSTSSLTQQLKTLLDAPELIASQVAHNLAAVQRIRPEDICEAYVSAFNLALELHSSPQRLSIPIRLDQRPA